MQTSARPSQPLHSARDELLAQTLAIGTGRREAAVKHKIAERTVYNRLADPAFMGRVTAIRRDLLATALSGLYAASGDAVATLKDLLDPKYPPTVRLGASRAIIGELLDVSFASEVSDELESLKSEIELLKMETLP